MHWKGLRVEEGTLLIMAKAFLGIPRSIKSCLGAIKKIILKKKEREREDSICYHLFTVKLIQLLLRCHLYQESEGVTSFTIHQEK